MADIVGKARIEVSATFTFTEGELRALDALVGYGDDAFIKHFYEKLGKAYMEHHEKHLRSLFKCIRRDVPPILNRVRNAAKALEGAE